MLQVRSEARTPLGSQQPKGCCDGSLATRNDVLVRASTRPQGDYDPGGVIINFSYMAESFGDAEPTFNIWGQNIWGQIRNAELEVLLPLIRVVFRLDIFTLIPVILCTLTRVIDIC